MGYFSTSYVAAKFDRAHDEQALHATYEWLHKEDREPAASVALGYFAYNFMKIHRTLRTSPAMAAGVTDRLWEVSDLVALGKPKNGGQKSGVID